MQNPGDLREGSQRLEYFKNQIFSQPPLVWSCPQLRPQHSLGASLGRDLKLHKAAALESPGRQNHDANRKRLPCGAWQEEWAKVIQGDILGKGRLTCNLYKRHQDSMKTPKPSPSSLLAIWSLGTGSHLYLQKNKTSGFLKSISVSSWGQPAVSFSKMFSQFFSPSSFPHDPNPGSSHSWITAMATMQPSQPSSLVFPVVTIRLSYFRTFFFHEFCLFVCFLIMKFPYS